MNFISRYKGSVKVFILRNRILDLTELRMRVWKETRQRSCSHALYVPGVGMRREKGA